MRKSLPKVNLQRKTQLQLKQPLSNRDIDDNDNIVVDDEVTFGRNKKVDQFGKLIHEDVELSDYVKFRLWLARQLALKKFNETRA
jgi:hypothetical protein